VAWPWGTQQRCFFPVGARRSTAVGVLMNTPVCHHESGSTGCGDSAGWSHPETARLAMTSCTKAETRLSLQLVSSAPSGRPIAPPECSLPPPSQRSGLVARCLAMTNKGRTTPARRHRFTQSGTTSNSMPNTCGPSIHKMRTMMGTRRMFNSRPAFAISGKRTKPLPKTIALGGVPTGNI
jgi:hypothetical protein